MTLVQRVCVAAVMIVAPPTVWLTLAAVGYFPVLACCVMAGASVMVAYLAAQWWFRGVGDELIDTTDDAHDTAASHLGNGLALRQREHRETCQEVVRAESVHHVLESLTFLVTALNHVFEHLSEPCGELEGAILLDLERASRGLERLAARLDIREGTRPS